MSPVWQIALCASLALAATAAGSCLAAASVAVAAYKFANLNKPEKPKLSGAAKYCVLNSEKTASVVSLGRRFLFAVGTVMAYFAADGMDELVCGARPSPFSGAAIAVAAALAVLFVQYAVFDIPAMRLGRNFPEKTMAKLGGAMYAAFAVFLPFEFLSRRLGARLLPKKLKDLEVGFDYIDVEMMLRAEENDAEAITPYTGKIVKNAFKLQELDASDVMLPRSQVVYLDTECSNAENVARATESNHTRYPLCKDDLDNCFGIVHIKDIFINGGVANPDAIDFMKIRRETFRVRENDKLESALAKLLKYRLHMALVEDEFGGVIGVLTLDAALGELVGKIRDEFDRSRTSDIKALGRKKYLVRGRATLRSVEDFLDVDFDTDEVSTFGGLITFLLGRFPEKGERLYLKEQRMRIRIDTVEDKLVGECTVEIEDAEKNED